MLKSYLLLVFLAFSPLLANSQSQSPPSNFYSKEFALLVSDSVFGGDTLYNYGKTNEPFGLQTNFMDVDKITPEANCTDAWAEIHSRLLFFRSNTFSYVPNSTTDSVYSGVYLVPLDSSGTGNRSFNQLFKLKGNTTLVVDSNATDSLSFLFAANNPHRITLVILGKAKIKVLQNFHGEILFKKSIDVKSILNSYTSILGTGNLTLPSTTSVYSEGIIPEYVTTFADDTILNITNLSNTFYPRWLYERTALNDNNILISAKVFKIPNSQTNGYKVKVSASKLPNTTTLSEYEFPINYYDIPHVDVAINNKNEISVVTSIDSLGQVIQGRGIYVNIFRLDTCTQLVKIVTHKITSNAAINLDWLYKAFNMGYGVVSTKINDKGKIAIAYVTVQNTSQPLYATAVATISKNNQAVWGNPSVLNQETKVLSGFESLRQHRYEIAFDNEKLIICEFNETGYRSASLPRHEANGGNYKAIIYNFPNRYEFEIPYTAHNYGSRHFSLSAYNGKIIVAYIREPWANPSNVYNDVGYVAFASTSTYQQISSNSSLRTNYFPNIGWPFISAVASNKGIRIVNSAYHSTFPTAADERQNHIQVTDLNFSTFQVTNSQDNIGFGEQGEWNDNWHVNYLNAHVTNFGLYASTFGGALLPDNSITNGTIRTRIQIQGNPVVDPFNLLRKRHICEGDSIELILKNYNLPGSYFWFANECCDTIKGYGRIFKYKSLAGTHSVRVVYRDTSGAEMFYHFCIQPKTKAKVLVSCPQEVCTNENPLITVSGGGPYSFSINGGAFQTHSSPFTANLTLPGDNYVTIRNIADTSLFCPWDTTVLIRRVSVDLQMMAGEVACGQDSVVLTLSAVLVPSNINIQGITYTIQRQNSSNAWVTVYQGTNPVQTVSVDILNALTSSPELIRNFRAFATVEEIGCSDSASISVAVPINPYISRPYIQLIQNGSGIVQDTITIHDFTTDSVTSQVYDVWLCANTPTKIYPFKIKASTWFNAFNESGTPPYYIRDVSTNQQIDIDELVSVGPGQTRIYEILVRSKTGCLSLPTKIRLIGVGSAMGEIEASDTKTCVGSEIYVNFKGMFYLGNLGTKKWSHPGAEVLDSTTSPVHGRHLRFNSPGVYTVTFTVHRQGCDQTFEKTIEVEGEPILGYCCSRSYNTGPFPPNETGITESEIGIIGDVKKYSGTTESPVIFSGKYHVVGSLVLEGNIKFLPNTQFYIDGVDINEQGGDFETCSEPFSKVLYPFINFPGGTIVDINSTSFQSSCAGMWQGLIVSPGCTFTLKGSTVNDAITGITWIGSNACGGSENPESVVQISTSKFSNNLVGVLAENLKNPTSCRIDSNTFINQRWGLKLPFYNDDSLRYIPLCGIAFHQPDYDSTNFGSMSLKNNVFEEMKLGMAGLRPTMRIFRNHFKNCHKAAMTTYDFRLNPPTFAEQLSEPLYLENNTIELPDHRWFETRPLEGYSPLALDAEHLRIARPTTSLNLTGEPNVYGILSNAPLWVQGTPGQAYIRGFSETNPYNQNTFPQYRMTPRTTFGIYSQLMDAESLTESGYSADKLVVNGYHIDSVRYGVYSFKIQTNASLLSAPIEIENNWFRSCDSAFTFNKWNSGANMQTVPLLVRENKVDSSRVAFSLDHLGTASPTKLTFTCNDLRFAKKESSNYPHIGLLLKSGFRLMTNIAGNGVIGGPGGSNENDNPNSNVWPILNHPNREHHPCSTTDDVEGCATWVSPTNWISVSNQTGEKVVYYRYRNEYTGICSPIETGGIFLNQTTTTLKCYTQNNIPIDTTNYVQVCGNEIDFVDPVFPVRPGAPAITSVKQEMSDSFLGNPVPNPASGQTSFQYLLPAEWRGLSTLEIVDVGTGKVVDSKNITEPKGELALDASRFPSGVYVCRIRSQQGLIWKWRKLVVVK